MTNKSKVLLFTASAVIAFSLGRYSVAEKIKVIEVEKKVITETTDRKKETNRKILKKKITRPDGTIEETKRIIDKSKDTTKKGSVTSIDSKKNSESIKSSGLLTIEGLIGTDVGNLTDISYGMHISTDLVGPVRVGVWGLTSGTIGVSLGLGF